LYDITILFVCYFFFYIKKNIFGHTFAFSFFYERLWKLKWISKNNKKIIFCFIIFYLYNIMLPTLLSCPHYHLDITNIASLLSSQPHYCYSHNNHHFNYHFFITTLSFNIVHITNSNNTITTISITFANI